MNHGSWKTQPHRSGLTRAEVVVVIGLIAMLCAGALPAIIKSKGVSYKTTCFSNIRQVALAHVTLSSYKNGYLSSLLEDVEIENELDQFGRMPTPWPIQLLPLLDNASLLKRIRKNAVVIAEGEHGQVMTLAETEKIVLPVFTCPEDPNTFLKPGGLSYVVNAGFISRALYHGDPNGLHRLGQLSWDGNDIAGEEEDLRVSAATGVFWRNDDSHPLSLDEISQADGMSQTILLSENLQAGMWFDTDTAKIAFGLPIETKGNQVLFGAGTFLESVAAPLNTVFTGGSLATASPSDWRINADLKAKKGTRPRPSSRHEGGVSVMFADGSCRFLNEKIDPHVYAQLMTPDGSRYGEHKPVESSY